MDKNFQHFDKDKKLMVVLNCLYLRIVFVARYRFVRVGTRCRHFRIVFVGLFAVSLSSSSEWCWLGNSPSSSSTLTLKDWLNVGASRLCFGGGVNRRKKQKKASGDKSI